MDDTEGFLEKQHDKIDGVPIIKKVETKTLQQINMTGWNIRLLVPRTQMTLCFDWNFGLVLKG